LLIGKAEEKSVEAAADRTSVRQRVRQIMAQENIDEKAALKRVARERSISKSEAYRELQRSK
jgi:16S rRNA (cytidine1402-2'-O)-methyltransferase